MKETKSTYKLAIRNHALKVVPSHVIPHVIPYASETSQHTGSIGRKSMYEKQLKRTAAECMV